MVKKLNVRILTADRYFPWNGVYRDKDYVISETMSWGDLDAITGIPFLIYSEGVYKGEDPEYICPKISIDQISYFITILLKSWILGMFKDRRLFLGHSPIRVIKKFMSNALKKQRFTKDIFRWYLTYCSLREYLKKNDIDVIIHHGEFNGWGIAVSWACRDSGVVPIAHQHGFAGPKYEQYQNLEVILKYISPALLVISKNQYDFFKDLPIKTYIAGSRRIKFLKQTHEKQFDYLILPTTHDTVFFQNEIKKSNHKFFVKPHPLRLAGWNMDNITVLDDNVEVLISKSQVVIATAGFSLIHAIKHNVKLILIDCKESRKSQFIRCKHDLPKTLDDAISQKESSIYGGIDYYYKECDKKEYLEIIYEIFKSKPL